MLIHSAYNSFASASPKLLIHPSPTLILGSHKSALYAADLNLNVDAAPKLAGNPEPRFIISKNESHRVCVTGLGTLLNTVNWR